MENGEGEMEKGKTSCGGLLGRSFFSKWEEQGKEQESLLFLILTPFTIYLSPFTLTKQGLVK